MDTYFFTSESVTEGHPDKMCDIISDSILDAIIEQDKNARVACEVATKNGGIMVFGEITTTAWVDINKIAREAIKEIGYTKSEYGIEYETCTVWTQITEQSPDIAIGVDSDKEKNKEQGAGDQGMMFGYASNETPEMMPLPILLAHRLTKRLSDARKNKEIRWLRPDGKAQVTVEYSKEGKPLRVDAIVVSTQHDEGIEYNNLKEDIKEKIIMPVCKEWVDEKTRYFINPTGNFVRGGPYADAGLTGRKIIVDTYGGMGRHGGGAFSGKDPSKVDRSGAYMARYIAKNIVAAGLADKCEVQLAYAIGHPEPVSINVDTFGTEKTKKEDIVKIIRKVFNLRAREIVETLDLKRPIYKKTAAYGHFGKDDPDFTWEKTDKVEDIKDALKEISS